MRLLGKVVEVQAGEALVFNGSESFDPDGDALYYLWEVVYKPLGSAALFSDEWAGETVFVPDLAGDYELPLIGLVLGGSVSPETLEHYRMINERGALDIWYIRWYI